MFSGGRFMTGEVSAGWLSGVRGGGMERKKGAAVGLRYPGGPRGDLASTLFPINGGPPGLGGCRSGCDEAIGRIPGGGGSETAAFEPKSQKGRLKEPSETGTLKSLVMWYRS